MARVYAILNVLSLLVIAHSAQAAVSVSCGTDTILPDAISYIQHAPSFFTKAVPIPKADKLTHFKDVLTEYGSDWDLGTYIGESGGDNNRIMILNRQKTYTNGGVESIEFKVPGPFDPVPSPDGRILSVASPMRIYDIREFLVPGHRPMALHDSLIGGVYQSIAWLRPGTTVYSNAMTDLYPQEQIDPKERIYRMVTDNSSYIPMIDFAVKYIEDCNVVEAVQNGKHCVELRILKPQNQEEIEYDEGAWKQCGDKTLKTLFISRKGTYLSGFSNSDGIGTSKVLDISKPGECNEVMDFGHPTGKIDFNERENRMSFHIDYLNDHSGGYFSRVDGSRTKDVFVVDFTDITQVESRQIRRVSTTLTKGQGCYYPSFFNDGEGEKDRLLCMFDEGNEGGMEDGYSFRTTTINDQETSFGAFLPSLEGEALDPNQLKSLYSASIVGLIWGKACNPQDHDEYTAVQAASLFLNIKYEDCEEIARYWGGDSLEARDLRMSIASERRFEDDPRFQDPSFIANSINSEVLMKSCEVAKAYQEKLRAENNSVETKTFGSPAGGEFIELTGPEIAERKCTGCHHAGISLNPVIYQDIDAGIQSFPNIIEFGAHKKVSLMYLDASLERLGFDPTSTCEVQLPGPITQDSDILAYLGIGSDEELPNRMMPPPDRGVVLRENGEYNEKQILVEYFCDERRKRIKEIVTGQEED